MVSTLVLVLLMTLAGCHSAGEEQSTRNIVKFQVTQVDYNMPNIYFLWPQNVSEMTKFRSVWSPLGANSSKLIPSLNVPPNV
ncbi:hypothetical protein E2C01_045083 [Portunus trituberculatus]|uniref:Spondin domain-containing protein n=1 Tax=Portunus trituberculatus TaxID=210409 RepID=A0A5B7G141_PORTR|nr:hypothetical protein [Portunus trituberculatus]